MVPTALFGAIVHCIQGTMLVRQGICLGMGCATGSFIGGQFSGYINDSYLRNIFSCTVFSLGVRAVFKAI